MEKIKANIYFNENKSKSFKDSSKSLFYLYRIIQSYEVNIVSTKLLVRKDIQVLTKYGIKQSYINMRYIQQSHDLVYRLDIHIF